MSKVKKYLFATLFIVLLLFAGVSCDDKNETYTGFLEGYKKEVEVGDSLTLKEYVDYVDGVSYTLIAQQGDTTVNLSKRKSWNTADPGLIGEWKLIYTIAEGEYKGEYVGTIQVVAPMLSFSFVITEEAITYEPGATMVYRDFFTAINLLEDSYFPCTITMRSVLFNGVETDLTDTTEYTFTERGTHYFTFTLESEDGQSRTAIVNVFVLDLNTAPVVAYQGLWTGDTRVERVERVPDDFAVQVTKADNQAYSVIGFDDVWLAEAFADERTTSVSFKIYADYASYRKGGGYNNSFYRDNAGTLIRTSWTWCTYAVSKTDGYFAFTLSKAEYEKWLTAKGTVASDMYLSIGFQTESGGAVNTVGSKFYIDDIVVDKAAYPFYGFTGKSAGGTNVNTTAKLEERVPGDDAAKVIKSDDQIYSVFGIDATWLAEAFADTTTTGVSFKLYSEYPTYVTGSSYNNSWVKDTSGKLQRTSWAFASAPTYTDGYFLITVSRAQYEKWLGCLTNGKDVSGSTISVDPQSAMYLSIGLKDTSGTVVKPAYFYIDDLTVVKA